MEESFFSKVLDYGNKSQMSTEKSIYTSNLKLIRIAAVLVFCVSMYWIIIDRFSDSYNLNTYSYVCVVIQLLSSVYMFALPNIVKNRTDDRLMRISFLLYYFFIIAGVGVLTLSRNMDIVASGDVSPYTGVSVSAFYLFMFAFMPLPDKNDSVILSAMMVLCLVVPEFVAHTSTYSMFSHIVLCSCFIAAYYFFRKKLMESSEQETEVEILSKKLLEYSYCDSLTSILNRRALDVYIDYLKEHSVNGQIGVGFFDIDYFKNYNDAYGHINGDKVLITVADITRECLRGIPNTYVFRYGGDEFIVIYDGADAQQLLPLLLKIRKAVFDADIQREDGSPFDVISITEGGAIEKIPNTSGDYVKAADNQLCIGKTIKRNHVYFNGKRIEDI